MRTSGAARSCARGRALLGFLALVVTQPAPAVHAATFNVNTTVDAAGACGVSCSLRQAIIAANAAPGPHTINLPAGAYVLTLAGSVDDDAATGDLDIRTSGISMVGAGASRTTIQQTTADRVFDVNPTLADGFSFAISGVTISGGHTSSSFGGAGILYSDLVGGPTGTLTLTGCVVTANTATGGPGGGIAVSPSGNLVIAGSRISSNATSGQGGGIDFFVQGAGNLTITTTLISGNSAGASGDAGGGLRTSGPVGNSFTIAGSQILGNHATSPSGKGGAIANGQGTLVLSATRLVGNTAAGGGSDVFAATAGGTATANDDWWGFATGPGAGALGQNPGAPPPVVTAFLIFDSAAHIVTGAGPGGGPHVRLFDGQTDNEILGFFAYDPNFTGGVDVALGDVSGDGHPDIITGAGAGGGPHVRVFDGQTGVELLGFFAYNPAFAGGVYVAAGDVNGDGRADIITGAGAGGGPHVRVFDGQTGVELLGFFAYNPAFAGGVYVAAGDVNGDGRADIITGAGAGGGPHVRVFDGQTGVELLGFFAYNPAFAGGVYVAAGDVNGDGRADIITGAGAGGGPHVRVFDGQTGVELLGFFAYNPAFTGGVHVGAGDVSADGRADIITGAGAGGGPHVRVFDGQTGVELLGFFAYNPAFTGGVWIGGVPAITP